MAEHQHIQLVRRAMEAMSAGDTATLQQVLTRDCVAHLPGNHPLAGEHKGLDALLGNARRMREETNGTLRIEPQQLFLDGRGHVIALRRMTAERRGRRHDLVGATHFTIVGDRIAGIEVYEQDLDKANQLWG
jgi:uncharacterized protein